MTRPAYARRTKTTNLARLPARELETARDLSPPTDHERPQTRADCEAGGSNAERPCPFVGCQWHLALDVDRYSINVLFPSAEDPAEPDLEAMPDTCALDVADGGEHTLEEVGDRMNVTRERVRQIELGATTDLQKRVAFWDDDDIARATDRAAPTTPARRHLRVVRDEPVVLRSPAPTTRPSNVALVRVEVPVDEPSTTPAPMVRDPSPQGHRESPVEADAVPPSPPAVEPAPTSTGQRPSEPEPSEESPSRRSYRPRLTHPVTGETHSIPEWCAILGCSLNLLHWRRRQGWPLERVLTPPAPAVGRPRKGADASPGTLRRRAWERRVVQRATLAVSMPMPIELLERAGYRVQLVSDEHRGVVLFVERPEVP